MVAPLAGAWIEISNEEKKIVGKLVAPLAGAWIEITVLGAETGAGTVAPLAGAWIEIKDVTGNLEKEYLSLPSRERGLKCDLSCDLFARPASLPSRERGLKFDRGDQQQR